MKSTYKIFKESIKTITDYYLLLVDETKRQRLVGSTNEWILDNYYMISEQEKVLKIDLQSKSFRKLEGERMQHLENLLREYLSRCHYQVDKGMFFNFLCQEQEEKQDYFSYPEVCAILPLMKHILLKELADLCIQLESEKAYHYSLTDKSMADVEKLNEAARQNLMMMNLFNSLRKMTKLPVSELIDTVSWSEKMLKEEKADMYDQMYDRTKDDYRAMIVRLCKKRKMKEHDLVKELVEKADKKGEHVGWQLFPPKNWKLRSYLYIGIVSLFTIGLSALFAILATRAFSSDPTPVWVTILLGILMLVPISQIIIDLFNQLLYRIHKPINTFKLKFKDGLIPKEYATMVIMPTILKNKAKTIELLEQLEVYYLSNINRASNGQRLEKRTQNLYYTLIGDAAAGPNEDMPWDDEVVQAGLEKVKELNKKYGAPIFNFVYRRRAYSEGESCWLGHERKRGAILHFNDLLLGNTTEEEKQKRFRCETISEWRKVIEDRTQETECPITFIITLDTDTELVLYSAQKLIGAMAHPLNRAQLAPDGKRVNAGYGIMQPRVNVDVEVTNKSRYAQLFAGLGGLDVYTTASFELYQDIFNEGSFCGKGIYDLRVFQHVLKGTFPENLILSHDLIEGCHIRCGLINDLELFDDNPSNYIDDAKRHHRWTRGDWQIIGWLRNRVRNEKGEKVKNQVNTIGRWKIFDNLRRSVLSLALLVVLIFGFTRLAWLHPVWFVAASLIIVASPIVFFILGQITKLPRFEKRYRYYATLMRGFRVIIYRSLVQFALLPKEAWMYTDALIRACYRLWFSHKNLLNWITSDEAAKSTKGTLGDYIGKFWFNYVASAILIVLFVLFPGNIADLVALAFCVITWCGAPFLMYWLGKKFPQDKKTLNAQETENIKQIAKDTWHYFDSLITEETHYLIPDNYQINRAKKADYKTSPTNIGYSITSVISAAEMGFITHDEAVDRLGKIIATVDSLPKWNGHLFNWYHVETLKALPNFFISTCDSGNFVACLYVLKGYLLKEDRSQKTEVRSLLEVVERMIKKTDFSKLYNPELDVFSIGYDYGAHALLPYHYNNFASEARLTSFLTIAQGDAPYKHWFCLDKTLVQYKGYKGVASWYGTLFEYFMPLIFLPTFKHTLMDETYSFAIRAQRAFMKNVNENLPWGISETAYNELDDGKNYKYHAFGVPYLKFQNTTPDRIVLSPYSSLLAISVNDRAVYDNVKRFKTMDMYDDMGFFESYDEDDHVPVHAHYAHHQGMILASLANYLSDHCLQRYFMQEPVFRSMETLLKEKAQVQPYIDLKVTQYKRYQYSKVQTESDARDYDGIANVPEIGVVSNGKYTVLINDRGSGFSRYRNILINRYRKITADHYGTYLYIRNLNNDKLWSNTYSPLDMMPSQYRVSFASDKITFMRVDDDIETKTEITVIKDYFAEIRRYSFTNNGNQDVDLELTSYGEVILTTKEEDAAHRVFNSMKIHSEYDQEHEALIFSKPTPDQNINHYAIHKLFVDNQELKMNTNTDEKGKPQQHFNIENSTLVEYETSRVKFLGRGGSIRHAHVIDNHRTLSNTVGTTLDPIMSMRRRIHVPAGKSVSAFVITGFAMAREQLIQLVEQYQNTVDIEDAFKKASVYNNMRTDMSLLKGSQMRLYNSISKYILQTATFGNQRQELLAKNTLSQNGLWRFGISGDHAIVLMEIDDINKSGFAKEMLRAFEYYKVHGMVLDLVFINDVPGDDHDGLTHFIRNMANTEHLWAEHEQAGKVYIINGNEISEAERILLRTVSRVNLNNHERIEQQLQHLEAANQHYQDKVEYPVMQTSKQFRVWSSLDFYNQYGGFDNDGRDYVVTNTNTPMPWINVIANPRFGCIISSTMAGFTFAFNAQQFKLTGWSNDIVRDNASEMLLINKKQFVPATARHGQGFSAFDAQYDDINVKTRVFVAKERLEKYYQIKIENKTEAAMDIELDMVYKLVLGTTEEKTARYLYSEWDEDSHSIFVRNVYHNQYRDTRVQLTAVCDEIPVNSYDYSLKYPNRKRLGMTINIPAHKEIALDFIIAVLETPDAQPVKLSHADINAEFDKVIRVWDEKLSTIQVDTPDRSFNYMLNRWYLYQVYASRLFARAGFYQVGGATGFRDQLQDVMSCLYSDPDYARNQILDHAAHQFNEGDVLHWWHESMKIGARTTFSDDYLWLVYVAYQYITITGDLSILTESVPFCQAPQLGTGETERCITYSLPAKTQDGSQDPAFTYASLYEHLRRAVNRSMSRIGIHGLPLMGCGDWNDGMSNVGAKGKGESVWVALFLCDLLPKMERLTQLMPDADLSYCEELSQFRSKLVKSLQENAWDGFWFLRAYFDNGDPMGSRNNTECQIDLITQAWSILTDVSTPEQKMSIFRETDGRLVNREHEIIQLLTPPFKNSADNPGYIMQYPEGVRENGGQYTHGAMWYIMAQVKEGRTDMAYFLYSLINPIHRTQTLADVLKYKVEPYCIAADIYSNPQHPGRGGWTWYTGSASWAYKTGIENILGLKKEGNTLTVSPNIPSEWDHFSIRYRFGSSTYLINYVRNDEQPVKSTVIDLVDDGKEHTVTL